MKNLTIQNIDTDTDAGLLKYNSLMKSDSPLFKEIENRFNDYLDGCDNDTRDMYYSEDAIYTAKGAIKQAIEMIFEVMQEENLKQINLNSSLLDYDAIWQN